MQVLTYPEGHWQIQYFLSSPLVSSFLFGVVSVPNTGFCFDTNPVFLHVPSFKTLAVAQVCRNIQVWQYFVINKSRVHYLVTGKSLCLGHCFQSDMNCLALRWPIKALFPLCLYGQFQVSLPALQEAKHTTSLQCCPVGVVSAFHSSRWIFALTLRTFHSH